MTQRETSGAAPGDQPLSDLMLAMDVVDTLRHQQVLIERELNATDRDRKMIERLREIYQAQGIEVPDAVLEQGVAALKEDRFAYRAPPPSLQTRLARLYIDRGRWGKPLLLGLAAVTLALLAWLLVVRWPEQRALAALPGELQQRYTQVQQLAREEAARERGASLYQQGTAALARDNPDAARESLATLEDLREELDLEYDLRIVARPGERSGIWRVPDANTGARNYYLIVEAIGANGQTLERSVLNEEDGSTHRVSKWGLRVDQATFERVAADKQDDGIIQNNRVGHKPRGYLAPQYTLPTSGGAITSW